MKVCIRCHAPCEDSHFFKRSDRPGKFYAHCKDCHRKMVKRWAATVPHKQKEYCKRWGRGLRTKALQVVSGLLIPKCKCCGESIIEFLQIDHVNWGGTKESKTYGNHRDFFLDIIRGKRQTSDLQVLCANCNHARGRKGGVCPHERMRLCAQ